MSDELKRLREEIDALDEEVLRLLAERFRRVVSIGNEKLRRGLAIEDPEREADVARHHAAAAAAHGLDQGVVEGLFTLLLRESKRHQREAAVRPEEGSPSSPEKRASE